MRRRPRSPDRSTASPEEHALRALGRRPLTAAELRSRLESAGHGAAVIDETCATLAARGWLDDGELARHYIVTRAERLGHGPGRLIEGLVRRGVARAVAQAAWDVAVAGGEVSLDGMLNAQIARRLARRQRALDAREYARVYNSLLRAGFPGDAVERALAPRRATSEVNDDLP